MQIFDYLIEQINIDDIILDKIGISCADINKIMFIDIETTGLTPKNCFIYLIGCGYYEDNKLLLKLIFADSRNDEKDILSEYFKLIKNHPYLIHFNGQKFDIPFIDYRANFHKLSVPSFDKNIDIYKIVKPYKALLSLPNLKQKTIESFLNITRKDLYSGGELINVYKEYEKEYLNNPYNDNLSEKLSLLLLHNYEDVLNMDKILPILKYTALDDLCMHFETMEINDFITFENLKKNELLIKCSGDFSLLPTDINIKKTNGIYIKINCCGEAIIRIPLLDTPLKYYFSDYKNYYYLEEQNIIIHKNACMGIAKEKLTKATKNNCFITVNGLKMPYPLLKDDNIDNVKILKNDYKEKEAFILLTEFENLDNSEKSHYINKLIYGF